MFDKLIYTLNYNSRILVTKYSLTTLWKVSKRQYSKISFPSKFRNIIALELSRTYDYRYGFLKFFKGNNISVKKTAIKYFVRTIISCHQKNLKFWTQRGFLAQLYTSNAFHIPIGEAIHSLLLMLSGTNNKSLNSCETVPSLKMTRNNSVTIWLWSAYNLSRNDQLQSIFQKTTLNITLVTKSYQKCPFWERLHNRFLNLTKAKQCLIDFRPIKR